jgi:hypothetical protein
VWVVLAILAWIGLSRLRGTRVRPWLLASLLALSLPSTLLILSGAMDRGLRPSRPAFRPAGEVAAFDWLAREADPGSVVLAAFETGNALPAWAPVRVVIGHGPESVGLPELKPQVEAFYRSTPSDEEQRAFLERHAVRFVLLGPAERALGEWPAEEAPYLQVVYRQREFEILRVELP